MSQTTNFAVDAFKARVDQLAVAEIIGGLEPLTVMELIEHLDLTRNPCLATDRETVADWAKAKGLEALKAALVAVNVPEAGR